MGLQGAGLGQTWLRGVLVASTVSEILAYLVILVVISELGSWHDGVGGWVVNVVSWHD